MVRDRSLDIDVTNHVDFGTIDDELLPITCCVCGHVYESWKFYISIYPERNCYACPYCGRKLYFIMDLKVMEVVDNG